MAGWSGFVLVCNWVETLVVVITLLDVELCLFANVKLSRALAAS